MTDIDPSIEHLPTFEESDVLAMLLGALRRDLTGHPLYDGLSELQRDALTAAVVASLDEILPGFVSLVRANAVAGAITAIGQLRGYPEPIGSTVAGALTELVIALEDERDLLLEPDGRSFFDSQ